MTWVAVVLAILLGAAAMAAGQADDSPGLGGFGLLLILAAVAYGARTARRSGGRR